MPGGIKGQENFHVGSSVMSRDRQENTARSWEHLSLLCGAKSKGAMDPLCSLHVLGRCRHKACPFTFLLSPPCTTAEGMRGWTPRVPSVCPELRALRNAGQGWVTEQDMNLPRG